ncbi:DNA-directed RNA polymerase subunit alpha [Gossypium arboreum]|uniref:DNA-directed RNA polymerase subunit alpha n=1 Tax=Gossypium arboreum TaxID=29729 RepID=A0A0B0N0Z3_GOSAR|nr:DNA-directed RNA polymerase subunit alpha [Gossypium arboreum]
MPMWPGRVSHTNKRHARVINLVDIRNGITWSHASVNRPCDSHGYQTCLCHRLCENRAYILTCTTRPNTCPCALAVVETDLGHTANHTLVCLARVPFEMAKHAMCQGYVPHTATRHARVFRPCSRLTLNCRTTPRDTQPYNIAVCRTRPRHTPVSLLV